MLSWPRPRGVRTGEVAHKDKVPSAGDGSADAPVLGLRKDPHVGRGGELRDGVLLRRADSLKVQDVEAVQQAPFVQLALDLRLLDVPLVVGCVSAGVHQNLQLVAALVEDGQLGGGRRRMAPDAGDVDAVLCGLGLDLDAAQVCLDVAVEVDVALELVQELASDRVGRDEAAQLLVFGDDAFALVGDFGDRRAEVDQGVDGVFVRAGEVSARGIRGTLDEMAGNQRSGEFVIVCFLPAMPPGCGCEDGRCIGHPAAYDDVGGLI